jgi:hypothetical protein
MDPVRVTDRPMTGSVTGCASGGRGSDGLRDALAGAARSDQAARMAKPSFQIWRARELNRWGRVSQLQKILLAM